MNSSPPRCRLQGVFVPLVLALVACADASAQTSNTQTQTPAVVSATTAQSPAQSNANQPVRLNVIVTDKADRSVGDLRQEDFRVEEDGVPQAITFFSREAVPVSYGVLVDNSGSMKPLLDLLKRTTASLLAANQPGDEAMLSRFVDSESINMLVDFTADPNALAKALSLMRTEGGQTALIDAVYLNVSRIAERRAEEPNRRRALVLLTDGEDRASYHKFSELEKLLAEADVQLFVIGIIENLDSEGGFTRPSPKAKAVKLINTLAQKTGGRAFYAKDVPQMISVINEITRDLRAQYVVGYQTSNANRDGKFRKVEIKLNEDAKAGGKRTVHARPGYFAPGGKAAEKDGPRDKSRRQTSP